MVNTFLNIFFKRSKTVENSQEWQKRVKNGPKKRPNMVKKGQIGQNQSKMVKTKTVQNGQKMSRRQKKSNVISGRKRY